MATTKTLTPTNQTITIQAFQGEKPDYQNIADAEGKLADAVNALDSHMTTLSSPDLNDMKESGLYYVSGASNSPGGSSSNWWGYVCVIANSGKTEVKQIFYNNSSDEEYTRYYRNNAWSDWNNKFSQIYPHTGSFSFAVVMGNYVTGYGCTGFVPFMRSDTLSSVTLNSVTVYGTSGDKKADFSVGSKYMMGFVLNCSADYSGKSVTINFTAA